VLHKIHFFPFVFLSSLHAQPHETVSRGKIKLDACPNALLVAHTIMTTTTNKNNIKNTTAKHEQNGTTKKSLKRRQLDKEARPTKKKKKMAEGKKKGGRNLRHYWLEITEEKKIILQCLSNQIISWRTKNDQGLSHHHCPMHPDLQWMTKNDTTSHEHGDADDCGTVIRREAHPREFH
jgi:hypothetical protein